MIFVLQDVVAIITGNLVLGSIVIVVVTVVEVLVVDVLVVVVVVVVLVATTTTGCHYFQCRIIQCNNNISGLPWQCLVSISLTTQVSTFEILFTFITDWQSSIGEWNVECMW